MSGRSGFSTGRSNDEVSCDSLSFQTSLSSPKSEAIEGLKVGDFLQVSLIGKEPNLYIVAYHYDRIAGGISSGNYLRMKKCLLNGSNFKAEEMDNDEGNISINITPSI